MNHSDPQYTARLAAYETVSTQLSLLTDRRLDNVATAATVLGSGIGGRSAELAIGETPVFVKRVPLTDVELLPENTRSTANLFGLPMFYQYGVGSAGFGAWRELAAHTMTTDWVLANEYEGFPLMYHWRVLPDSPPEGFADEFGGIDGAVVHWEGSTAVRERLEAIDRSSHSLVIFLEHVPQTLGTWLARHRDAVSAGGESSPYLWAMDALTRGTGFMRSRGFVHFDAHFSNVLTDGQRIYFADFGLALSFDFELSALEAEFLSDHLTYDHYYTASHLLRHHLVTGIRGDMEHETFLREWIVGRRPRGVPSEIATIIDRYAAVAVATDEFHRLLLTKSKRTTFPAHQLMQALINTTANS